MVIKIWFDCSIYDIDRVLNRHIKEREPFLIARAFNCTTKHDGSVRLCVFGKE